jgi:hypothetical protein
MVCQRDTFLFLLVLLLLLFLALQSVVDLNLFQNCPPLFSVLLFTSPLPHAHLLHIFLKWLMSPQLRFPYTSSVFWFKKSTVNKFTLQSYFNWIKSGLLLPLRMNWPPQTSNHSHQTCRWVVPFINECDLGMPAVFTHRMLHRSVR